VVTTEFNIEGYPSDDFLELIREVRPAQATLVPDPPGVLTSNAGWDTVTHKDFLTGVVAKLKGWGIRTSLFVEATEKSVTDAAATGTDRVELYTESYAREYPVNPAAAVAPFARAAEAAHRSGLGLNAGHDLSLENLEYFRKNVPHLLEVSIGHALISDALYYGLENTIQMYLRKLRQS
jgi:pyridoxine 5-phosphate synthase